MKNNWPKYVQEAYNEIVRKYSKSSSFERSSAEIKDTNSEEKEIIEPIENPKKAFKNVNFRDIHKRIYDILTL